MTFAKALHGIGPFFDGEVLQKTRKLADDLVRTGTEAPVEVTSLPYGSHDRHKVDVYRAGAEYDRAIVFIPGGGFVGGSRLGYRTFGEYFARQGHLVFIADYRLAPEAGWPAGAQDVGALIDYVSDHARDLGPCKHSATLVGHSAGATHVAAAVFDNRFNASARRVVGRVVLLSGLYVFPYPGMPKSVLSYIGTDEREFFDRSTLHHLDNVDVPVAIAASELDPQPFLASALFLADRLSQIAGSRSQLRMLKEHNHISPTLTVGTSEDAFSRIVMS